MAPFYGKNLLSLFISVKEFWGKVSSVGMNWVILAPFASALLTNCFLILLIFFSSTFDSVD